MESSFFFSIFPILGTSLYVNFEEELIDTIIIKTDYSACFDNE